LKELTKEHKENLSRSIKNWWKYNRKYNPNLIKLRNARISQKRKGKISPLRGKHTGISPANKGMRSGIFIKCPECSNKFYKEPSSKRKFCSRKCFISQFSKYWHKFHPEIKNYSRRVILKKIIKCEKCGFPDKRILMVHHLDGNKRNNHLDNLKVLCPNCHYLQHLNSEGKLNLRGWSLV